MSWFKRYGRDSRRLRFYGSSESPFASWFPAGKERDYVELPSAGGDAPELSDEDLDVIEFLESRGYGVDAESYVAGLAKSPGGRQIRIGKILPRAVRDKVSELRADAEKKIAEISEEDEAIADLFRERIEQELASSELELSKLMGRFVNSPTRQAKGRDRVFMVVSRRPEDILNMSTGRSWTSCMDLEGGQYACDARKEAESGSLVAYAVREGDRDIEDPLARIHVKRFEDMSGNNVAMAEDAVYGQQVDGFREALQKWIDERQGDVPPGVYKRVGGEYSDTFGKAEVVMPKDPEKLYDLAANGIDESEYTRWKVVSRVPDEHYDGFGDGSGAEVAEFDTRQEAENYIADAYYDETWRDYYGGQWLETDEEGEYLDPAAEVEKVVYFGGGQARLEALKELAELPAGSLSEEQAKNLVEQYSERAKSSKWTWGRPLAKLLQKYPGVAEPEDMMDFSRDQAVGYAASLPDGPQKDSWRQWLEEDAASAAANVAGLARSHDMRPHEVLSLFSDALAPFKSDALWSGGQPSPAAVSETVDAALQLYDSGPVPRLRGPDGMPSGDDERFRSRYGLAAASALADAGSDLPDTGRLVSRLVSDWMPVDEEISLSGSIGMASLVPSIKTMPRVLHGIGDAAKQFLPEVRRRAERAREIYGEMKDSGADPRQVRNARRVWEAYLWTLDTVEGGERSKRYRLQAASWLERCIFAQPLPVGDDRCYDRAVELVRKNPGWKLFRGPAEPREIFWPEDTAHFWAVDDEGVVRDPTGYRYPGYDYAMGVEVPVSEPEDAEFPLAGSEVAGLEVGDEIGNVDSIDASLYDYEILDGIREVPISEFDEAVPYSKEGRARVAELIAEIRRNRRIDPLIVVVDDEGPYVLEGGHRLAALQSMGAKSIPALVVIDRDGGETA